MKKARLEFGPSGICLHQCKGMARKLSTTHKVEPNFTSIGCWLPIRNCEISISTIIVKGNGEAEEAWHLSFPIGNPMSQKILTVTLRGVSFCPFCGAEMPKIPTPAAWKKAYAASARKMGK